MVASFSIQAVAERTGLTPHVIRAWERRYCAIKPARSPGRHRLYSEAEIERLATLDRAVRSGHSIGKIARLPIAKLRALVAHRPASARSVKGAVHDEPAAPFRAEALAAATRFDGPALDDTLRRALVALGNQGLLRLAIGPLAQEIGERWRAGELTAAHEHFFTASVKVFLGDLARLLPASTRILAGGRAARGYFETLVRIGALYAESIEEFSTQLDSLRRIPARNSFSARELKR